MSNCRKCNLYKTSKAGIHSCVQINGTGNRTTNIMLVGEAPEYKDIVEKKLFTGKAGIELRKSLHLIGIKEEDIFLTDIVRCRPPGNRQPTLQEISICSEYLIQEIKEIKPKVIGILGNSSCLFFLKKDGISKLRGIPVWNKTFNCWIVPMYHPNYIIRFSQRAKQRTEFLSDLKKVKELSLSNLNLENNIKDTKVILIKTIKQVKELTNLLLTKQEFSFDTETTSLDPVKSKILCVTFSVKPGTGIYLPFQDRRFWNSDSKIEEVRSYLQIIFKSKINKIAHNGKFDFKQLFVKQILVNNLTFDTQVAAYLLDEEGLQSLDYLTSIYTKMKEYKDIVRKYITGKIQIPDGEEEIKIKMKKQEYQLQFGIFKNKTKQMKQKFRSSTILDCPLDLLIEYGCKDADATLQIAYEQKKLLEQEQLSPIFYKIIIPVIPVLAKMELKGILMDKVYIDRMCARINSKMKTFILNLKEDKYVKEYKRKTNNELNFSSPKQLQVLLFEIMKLDFTKKTNKGANSTDKKSLEKLQKKYKIKLLSEIIKYRKIQKFYKTYLLGYQKILLNSKDNKIHTEYQLTRTKTGRLSSKNPNLQNIPERGEESSIIKYSFITPKDKYFLEADYSQIEFMVFAHQTKSIKLIELAKDEDIHQSIASQIFKISKEKVTITQRQLAKTAVYGGIMYMGGAYILVSTFGISYLRAERIISEFFESFPKARIYIDNQLTFLKNKGYVINLFNRRRHLSDIYSIEEEKRKRAMRQGINAPIQSGAMDIMYIAMRRIDDNVIDNDCNLILNIHDALIFEVTKNKLKVKAQQIKQIMENTIKLSVSIKVKFKVGKSLGNLINFNI